MVRPFKSTLNFLSPKASFCLGTVFNTSIQISRAQSEQKEAKIFLHLQAEEHGLGYCRILAFRLSDRD
jgi:hypothetical protein